MRRKNDPNPGDYFGRLRVIEGVAFVGTNKKFKVICACGREYFILKYGLVNSKGNGCKRCSASFNLSLARSVMYYKRRYNEKMPRNYHTSI